MRALTRCACAPAGVRPLPVSCSSAARYSRSGCGISRSMEPAKRCAHTSRSRAFSRCRLGGFQRERMQRVDQHKRMLIDGVAVIRVANHQGVNAMELRDQQLQQAQRMHRISGRHLQRTPVRSIALQMMPQRGPVLQVSPTRPAARLRQRELRRSLLRGWQPVRRHGAQTCASTVSRILRRIA